MDFAKLFSFGGRVNRLPYWIISLVVFIPAAIIYYFTDIGGYIAYVLAYLIALATTVKRWHDRDKSGWWVLISFIPIIGWIWSFIELGLLPGTLGPNRFGNPSSGSPM
jgi:uncharacterized membrane protein YhaH (DUF805 family)